MCEILALKLHRICLNAKIMINFPSYFVYVRKDMRGKVLQKIFPALGTVNTITLYGSLDPEIAEQVKKRVFLRNSSGIWFRAAWRWRTWKRLARRLWKGWARRKAERKVEMISVESFYELQSLRGPNRSWIKSIRYKN